jgi:L-fuconolactonase
MTGHQQPTTSDHRPLTIHRLIDSHVHFWIPELLRYTWLADNPSINRRFSPKDLADGSAGLPLEKIVFVQADCAPEDSTREVEWVTELARDEPRIQGIVAFAPLENGRSVQGWLESLARNPLVKGVRRLIQSERPGFCVQNNFVEAVRLLPGWDFSFDICVYHHQLGDVVELVDQCPRVRFVLDHLGKPDARTPSFEPWGEQIATLAAYTNVFCKLSGLVTEADHERWTPQGLRPYIEHVVEHFGADRIMYGGDWPVSLLATSYRAWIEALSWAVSNLDESGRDKLFFANAEKFYRLH